MSWLNRNFCVC